MFVLRPDLNMSDWMHVSHRAADDLWLPELTVSNMVEVSRLQLMEETGMMRVRGDKFINTMYQLRMTLSCHTNLVMFPHDSQVHNWHCKC